MAISKITSKSIADGTVVGADITPGTVTNAKISPSAAIANAKLQNSSITVSGSSVSLGGSTTISTATDWQALTVADGSTQLTAVAGKGYFLDTNAGVIEVFLPTSPSRGDRIVLADYSGTFATNQCIINTGGKLIDSTTGPDFKLTTNNTIAELIYVDANKGWLVYLNQAAGTTPDSALTSGVYNTDQTYITATGGTVTTTGSFKVHTFTGDGCFVVSSLGTNGPCAQNSAVEYVVVAGGGGAGGGQHAHTAGGGGAGGYRESSGTTHGPFTVSPLGSCVAALTVTAGPTTYPITVGGGGNGGTQGGTQGSTGSNSVFSTITSTGGGGGGAEGDGSAPQRPGGNGGSGGGGSSQGAGTGGSGNTPPVSPPQGNNGGNATDSPPDLRGGGGGGATAAGGVGTNSPFTQGAGGAGATNHITGSPVTRAGGGGAGGTGTAPSSAGGAAGPGGGGAGGAAPSTLGTAGTANTGGGGGSPGVGPNPSPEKAGGNGGKGVVIIRYKFKF